MMNTAFSLRSPGLNTENLSALEVAQLKDALVRTIVQLVNSDALCIEDVNHLYDLYCALEA